ncbi:unnamed protein product [Periconia digitata]|uniref:Uncharacterized protein n=1 Tax=Periconia digitata TaxID=1303443 RepID=A0A9W4XMS2_9PLEO|nr:unnamed protein product [Periconia digitata]
MTSLLTITPPDMEPLPLYSRRDPDSISILSSAPSYVSETPTYTSHRAAPPAPSLPPLLPPLQPNQQASQGLPAPRYAPGFQNRAHGSPSAMSIDSIFATPRYTHARANNARQYDAVARRRANTQHANTTAILSSLSSSSTTIPTLSSTTSTPSPPRSSSPLTHARPTTATSPPQTANASSSSLFLPLESPSTTSPSSSSSANPPHQPLLPAYPVRVGSNTEPLNPLEDPYLVGEEAADRHRAARVYREMCLRGEEAAAHESRSWDFMMGQMSDWEERRRSWKGFRKSVGNARGVLGRRLVIGRAW